jgi:phospholipid/cholesterol/gamma-HCH transport system substrate-binding protein
MTPYRRNVAVGAVVLGGLIILGWMLIQFGGRIVTPFAPESITIYFLTDRADGISNGSAVQYRGVIVGRAEKITRADDQLHVMIQAALDARPPLPANVKAIIRSQGLIGAGASVVLETVDPTPQGTLKSGQTIETKFVGLDILPPEFAQLAAELRTTAQQFRESQIVPHLDEQVTKIGKVVDALDQIVADPQSQQNIRESLNNIRTVTERANKIADSLEKFSGDLQTVSTNANDTLSDTRATIVKTQEQILALSKQTSDRMQQLSKLLDQFQEVAEKVNKGQGTAGALVNDPRLYESLVDSARTLNATVSDLQRLVQQWEQEGVTLKLK